jgi:hypothetical protein
MRDWRLAGEPSLEELLEDEMMHRVMRGAGLDAREFRRRLSEIARRLRERGECLACGCRGAAFG